MRPWAQHRSPSCSPGPRDEHTEAGSWGAETKSLTLSLNGTSAVVPSKHSVTGRVKFSLHPPGWYLGCAVAVPGLQGEFQNEFCSGSEVVSGQKPQASLLLIHILSSKQEELYSMQQKNDHPLWEALHEPGLQSPFSWPQGSPSWLISSLSLFQT